MSCNCNGCGQPERLCRCPKGKGEAPKRAYIAECTDCDPCRPCESMVKICSFVTPTLTEGQRFRNSFVYNQEDDSVYYISDDGTPTRFGSSPMFINAFNPDDRKIPRQTVFDFANQKAYIYDPEGNYITVDLAGGSTGSDVYHVFIPSIDNVGEDSIGYVLAYTFKSGLHLEAPGITIKDDNGNTISPENFASELGKIASSTIAMHVPAMANATIDGTGSFLIPESVFYVKPDIATADGTTPIVDWSTDRGIILGESPFGRFVISATEVEGEYYYDAEITLPVKVEANA